MHFCSLLHTEANTTSRQPQQCVWSSKIRPPHTKTSLLKSHRVGLKFWRLVVYLVKQTCLPKNRSAVFCLFPLTTVAYCRSLPKSGRSASVQGGKRMQYWESRSQSIFARGVHSTSNIGLHIITFFGGVALPERHECILVSRPKASQYKQNVLRVRCCHFRMQQKDRYC